MREVGISVSTNITLTIVSAWLAGHHGVKLFPGARTSVQSLGAANQHRPLTADGGLLPSGGVRKGGKISVSLWSG